MMTLQNDYVGWYEEIRPKYEALASTMEQVIRSALLAKGYKLISVTSRAKSVESYIEKIKQKYYENPCTDVTDFAGVRVVCLTQDEADSICSVLKKSFTIHEVVNKSECLGAEEGGYRAVHMICQIGPTRSKLLEYKLYSDLKFEIQIHTILQHAWAQLDHNRHYKQKSKLPKTFESDLLQISHSITNVDNDFNQLAKNIDEFLEAQNFQNAKYGSFNLPDIANSLSNNYPNNFDRPDLWVTLISPRHFIGIGILDELKIFGINTLEKFEKALSDDLVDVWGKYFSSEPTTEYEEFIKLLMLWHDADRYFGRVHQITKSTIDIKFLKALLAKYSRNELYDILTKYGIGLSNGTLSIYELNAVPEEWCATEV